MINKVYLMINIIINLSGSNTVTHKQHYCVYVYCYIIGQTIIKKQQNIYILCIYY